MNTTRHSMELLPLSLELSRLLMAAVVSEQFRNLLLHDPKQALRRGYRGNPFHLSREERQRVLAIAATSLPDFAEQLINSLLTSPPSRKQEDLAPAASAPLPVERAGAVAIAV